MPSVSNRRFAPLTLLAALLAVVVLGACGSGGGKSDTAGQAPPSDRAEAPVKLEVGPQCAANQRTVVAAPSDGLYHAAMPSLLHDDALSMARSEERVQSFDQLAGRDLAWVYF